MSPDHRGRRVPDLRARTHLAEIVTAAGAAAGLGLAVRAASTRGIEPRRPSTRPSTRPSRRPARLLAGASALLAGSVLTDSGLEHYRGSFQNRVMVVPLAASALGLVASLGHVVNAPARRSRIIDVAHLGQVAVGAIGLAFHAYNLLRRPGGVRWINLFYAAPIGAPAALSLAGILGLLARPADRAGRVLGYAAARVTAMISGLGLLGTVGEAGLLHFRGAFHNPAMWLPVSIPPVAGGLLIADALAPRAGTRRLARAFLGGTAALGLIGVGFHGFGVARNMGGWRNWRQNLLSGPPLPAPPSFTALALAGLAALALGYRRDA